MANIILRNITQEDFSKICIFYSQAHITPVEDQEPGINFEKIIKKKCGWVAELDGNPIGCICLYDKNWVHISVLPEYRLKGFGKQMLEKLPVKDMTVWAKIPNSNVAAIKLFQSADYTDYDFTGDYVIMQRKY